MTNTRKLVFLSLLITLTVVLARFVSFKSDIIRVSLEFLPIAISAILFGPLAGGITAALADIVGGLVFPHGAFFPGFTISAFLSGIIYGLFLYKKKITLFRVIACVLTKLIVVDLILVTLWLVIFFKTPIEALAVARLIKISVMLPIEGFFVYFSKKMFIDKIDNLSPLKPQSITE